MKLPPGSVTLAQQLSPAQSSLPGPPVAQLAGGAPQLPATHTAPPLQAAATCH